MPKSYEKLNQISDLLTRGVEEVIERPHLEKRLRSGEKLRVKLGVDPTSASIHIGRAIALWKLRQFQELGHRVIFIVGDFTGLIGDTSDKESERPMLTAEQVAQNMADYRRQLGMIIDLDQAEFRHNSEWLKPLTYLEIAQQADQYSVGDFIKRENIAKRLQSGKRVSLREMLYPMMQGYDSVAVRADVEVGGTDQRFNLLAGRTMQRHYGQTEQNIMTFSLLEGLDGRKMSSSWGNTVNLTDAPEEMYGKLMSLRDELIVRYFTLATDLPLAEVAEVERGLKKGDNPRQWKAKLAWEITRRYHGNAAASAAQAEFDQVFQQGQLPSELPEVKLKPGQWSLLDLLVKARLAKSKSDAQRLVEQGGVNLDGETVKDWRGELAIANGQVLQVGKRKFAKIVLE